MRILLVDDDTELADLLREYFEGHEAELEVVTEGKSALELLSNDDDPFDAVLLDVMLPGDDGFAVCRKIRQTSDVPVIMLTARGDDDDRIVGLDLGADDYVPKPFNPRELLARLHAVLRRSKSQTDARARIVIGDLVIDVPAQKVSLGAIDLALTSFEFRLLVELARRAGRIVRRKELATALEFGAYDPSVDRSLDVHISHLRGKLQDDARDPKRIRTVRGIGYVLVRPS